MKDDTIPSVVHDFAEQSPDVWSAYNALGDAVAKAGPIDARTQRLLKLAIAVGAGLEGAVHSHSRRGLKAGCTAEELRQVALLAITTVGWPRAFAAHCWIQDTIAQSAEQSKGRE